MASAAVLSPGVAGAAVASAAVLSPGVAGAAVASAAVLSPGVAGAAVASAAVTMQEFDCVTMSRFGIRRTREHPAQLNNP